MMDITYCTDRKCLRHVCIRHPSNVPDDWEWPVSYSPFLLCEDRIRMKGDEVEDYNDS